MYESIHPFIYPFIYMFKYIKLNLFQVCPVLAGGRDRVTGDKRVQRIQKGPPRHRTDDVAKEAVPLYILKGNSGWQGEKHGGYEARNGLGDVWVPET